MRKAKRLPLEVLAPYLLELPARAAPLDWSQVFGNAHPVELEVGFGKGAFLCDAGLAHPDLNYVGIEIDRGLQLYVANRLAKRELKNVRLLRADAKFFLRDYVASESLAAVHVYFPDPWWKRRHKKRRVFTEEFAAPCERVLSPQGRLHVATDVEEYFKVMIEVIAGHTHFREVRLADSLAENPVTNFERKARQQGRAVWRTAFEKQ